MFSTIMAADHNHIHSGDYCHYVVRATVTTIARKYLFGILRTMLLLLPLLTRTTMTNTKLTTKSYKSRI